MTCVSECVAAFDALYAARIGKLTNEATELRLAMAPPLLLREDWREGLRNGEGAEEIHFHLPSPALDPLRIREVATEEADDARVVDQEVDVGRGGGGGRDLRRAGHIELERHHA